MLHDWLALASVPRVQGWGIQWGRKTGPNQFPAPGARAFGKRKQFLRFQQRVARLSDSAAAPATSGLCLTTPRAVGLQVQGLRVLCRAAPGARPDGAQ